MRICGIILVGSTVVLIGFCYINRVVERIKQLNKIKHMIFLIKNKIEYKKSKVNEILDYIILNEDFVFINCNSKDLKTICFKNNLLFINEAEKKSFYDFLSELGKTDLIGQLKHCDMYFSIFDEYEKKCIIDNSKKIKLFPTLFVLLGLLLIILLL